MERLECTVLDRSRGGGQRADGTAYFRDMLDIDCHGASNAHVGKLTTTVATSPRKSAGAQESVGRPASGSGRN